MIQNTEQARVGGIPRLAMMNSFAGFGRCSTAISLPVISAMQVQVCPVPTAILSNHLGFPYCHFEDYTSQMPDYLQVWEQLGLCFDGLYCGFLGSVNQIAIIKNFLKSPMMAACHDHPVFLLDPVMGDHGRAYSTITQKHCQQLKELAAYADILTPNITEACLLTDTPYKEQPFTNKELAAICDKLAALNPTASHKRIVITGLTEKDELVNFIWETGQTTSYRVKQTGSPYHGTGDLFASIIIADALHEVPFERSVKKAADFVALCIQSSQEAGLPPGEGILFEKQLGFLQMLLQCSQ